VTHPAIRGTLVIIRGDPVTQRNRWVIALGHRLMVPTIRCYDFK
jgi:hypothetical protein